MVTKDTMISDLIKEEPSAVELLAENGMRCAGCASVEGESIQEAAAEHGLDAELLVRKLNLRLYGRIV